MHCILCIVFYALYSMHCIICTIFYPLYSMQCILCIVFYELFSMHCILFIVFYALHSLYLNNAFYSMKHAHIMESFFCIAQKRSIPKHDYDRDFCNKSMQGKYQLKYIFLIIMFWRIVSNQAGYQIKKCLFLANEFKKPYLKMLVEKVTKINFTLFMYSLI